MILLTILLGSCLARDIPLREILRSPKETLRAYTQYKAAQHLHYSPGEDRLRFKLWRTSAELVAEENSRAGRTADLTLNFFAAMTEDEMKQWRGLNGTSGIKTTRTLASFAADPPAAKDWTSEGLVTPVKDQARCGSCWTFGAVGGLETRYALLQDSVLRNFAEKEYLDCVYEDVVDANGRGYNGCNGGWMHECYEYSANNGGRLAKTADYPYAWVDQECEKDTKPDSLIAAKIRGYIKVPENEAANIAAIAEGSITVAFESTSFFHLYSTGIIKDMTCTGNLNHAVTAVGYNEKYILVKNSWGTSWGEEGYVRYMRGHHNCGLYYDSYYPDLEVTGVADTGPDPHTDYDVTQYDDSKFDPVICKDEYSKCTQEHCNNYTFAVNYCKKTCDKCPEEDGCPAGTMRCDDGVCRHKHMC